MNYLNTYFIWDYCTMPYKIRKLRNKDEYIVKNAKTKQILSKHESLADARKQVDLLDDIDFKERIKHIKFPVNPFENY